MASQPLTSPIARAPRRPGALARFVAELENPARAICSPRLDMLLLWAAPAVALAGVVLYLQLGMIAFADRPEAVTGSLVLFSVLITKAHLMAVFPRGYLNREVFAAHRWRLILAPVLVVGAFLLSPTLLVIGTVVAVLWDVHHSAMQNFGLARIYDMKAGNPAQTLRRTDLALNWLLYVGPIFAGASFLFHDHALDMLVKTPLATLATWPGYLDARQGALGLVAMSVWALVIAWAVVNYRRAMARGYRLPAHKLAQLVITGTVSLLAWGFSNPVVALTAINIYHAVQYFAIVWRQEGGRMTSALRVPPLAAFVAFAVFCGGLGWGYMAAQNHDAHAALAFFTACSLLHFWYDGFVWSVRRKAV